MPEPPEVLLEAQMLSNGKEFELTDEAGYGTLHGGCGMLFVCEPSEAPPIIQEAIQHGVTAEVVGETVVQKKHKLTIKSRFGRKSGQDLFSKE